MQWVGTVVINNACSTNQLPSFAILAPIQRLRAQALTTVFRHVLPPPFPPNIFLQKHIAILDPFFQWVIL